MNNLRHKPHFHGFWRMGGQALAGLGLSLALIWMPAHAQQQLSQQRTDPTQAWSDLQAKAALNGLVQASVAYQGGQVQVLVRSKQRFVRPAAREQAWRAARLIQRDVAVFCGTHCSALPMPEPQWQADQTLRFELRLDGLGRQLFEEDLQALLSAHAGLPAAQPTPLKRSKGKAS